MKTRRVARWLYPVATFGVLFCGLGSVVLLQDFPLALAFVVVFILARGIERLERIGPKHIIYFRGFRSPDANRCYVDRFEPVASCLGDVLCVEAAAPFDPGAFTRVTNYLSHVEPSTIGSITLDGGEKERTGPHVSPDAKWKADLAGILPKVAVAVVHLSDQTDHVRWEMSYSAEILGPDRVLVIAHNSEAALARADMQMACLIDSSPHFQSDLADWLSRRLGPPGILAACSLHTYFKRGECTRFYFLRLLCVVGKIVRNGLRLSLADFTDLQKNMERAVRITPKSKWWRW